MLSCGPLAAPNGDRAPVEVGELVVTFVSVVEPYRIRRWLWFTAQSGAKVAYRFNWSSVLVLRGGTRGTCDGSNTSSATGGGFEWAHVAIVTRVGWVAMPAV